MHSKGTDVIVSTLISNQRVGAPMGNTEGAQGAEEEPWRCSAEPAWEETGRVMIHGQGTRWLRQGCQRQVGLAGRAGPGPALKMGPASRVEKQTQVRPTPVPSGRGQGYLQGRFPWPRSPGIWMVLLDGEQL